MIMLDFFNNLNSTINSVSSFEINLVITNDLSIILLNVISYLYIFLKFYKILCYSKMTFDWLPMINPYIWPFSFFRIATGWYFELFQKHFPTIVINKRGFNISTIVGLELLNSLTFCLVRISHSLIYILEDLEKVLK